MSIFAIASIITIIRLLTFKGKKDHRKLGYGFCAYTISVLLVIIIRYIEHDNAIMSCFSIALASLAIYHKGNVAYMFKSITYLFKGRV